MFTLFKECFKQSREFNKAIDACIKEADKTVEQIKSNGVILDKTFKKKLDSIRDGEC